MNIQEINELLAKADGWTCRHEWNFDGDVDDCVCNLCGALDEETDERFTGGAPDYTKSYPDLSRVERKVYGELGQEQLIRIFTNRHNMATSWLDGHEVSGVMHESEPHARAECLARVIKEQADEQLQERNVADGVHRPGHSSDSVLVRNHWRGARP